MTQLLDIRECEPVAGMKLLFCDVLESGASLPHSVLFYEWADTNWEETADTLHDCLFAAEIFDGHKDSKIDEWLDLALWGEVESISPVQLMHDPLEMSGCMNNADYDDLRNLSIGR